jgi:hypothetical protein
MSIATSWNRPTRLVVVLGLNLTLVGALVAVGITAHSLGVLAEGGDYLADAAAIGASILAIWLSKRSPTPARPHGYPKAGPFSNKRPNALLPASCADNDLAQTASRVSSATPRRCSFINTPCTSAIQSNLASETLFLGPATAGAGGRGLSAIGCSASVPPKCAATEGSPGSG